MKYRIVRRVRHALWRTGLIHYVPAVRLKYRGRWSFNGATDSRYLHTATRSDR